jgi:hypothetical protein
VVVGDDNHKMSQQHTNADVGKHVVSTMICLNTYSCWKEECRSKYVLQYHEKSLRENKQCKQIDPGCMKLINEKVKKNLTLNPYIWVLLQAHFWGKPRNLFDNIS